MVAYATSSAVQHAAQGVAAAAAFEPFFPSWIVLLPLLGFAVNGAIAYAAPDRRDLVSIVGPAVLGGSFALALINFVLMVGADPDPTILSYWSWIVAGDLNVEAALQIDRLSVLMALIVTGVSFIIHVYSVGYMREDPGYARYFAYLNLFVFFMLVLVLAANLPLTFIGWEGVGLCSYLLIGFWYQEREKTAAGLKAFIVNRIGDFGFLVGMFMLFAYAGTLSYTGIAEAAPRAFEYGGAAVTLATLFLFLGCVGKSAQIPLHVWLPDAMHGPTPVSALIHAATMVTAGVFLIARAAVLFTLAPITMNVVAVVGGVTAFFAATIALQQFDIKRVIAYSTISQLGYMFLAVGLGAFTAGIFHLGTHAFFKALLFLVSGAVIHAVQHALEHVGAPSDEETSQDMRNMGGLRRRMPITYATAWAAALALAGVFPFAGFFSKDEIIWAAGSYGQPILWALAIVTALLTAGYIARWMVMVFHGADRLPSEAGSHVHETARVMWIPLVVLAVGSVAAGWINVPEALPALPTVAWLHEFLHPAFASAEAIHAAHVGDPAHAAPVGGGEGLWAFISVALAVAVILVTATVLGRKGYRPAREAPAPAGLGRLLYRKWYVDEAYDLLIVRPIGALSRFSWRVVDQGLIDGVLVNGSAYVGRFAGWVVSRAQTGYVGTYVLMFVLGALIILGAVAL